MLLHLWHLSLIVGFKFNGKLKSATLCLPRVQSDILSPQCHQECCLRIQPVSKVGRIIYAFLSSMLFQLYQLCLKSCPKIAYYAQAMHTISGKSEPVFK